MTQTDLLQFLTLLAVVGVALWAQLRGYLEPLKRELRDVFPVFSAQTLRNTEAEFIRDRLFRRLPFGIILAVALAGATIFILWITLWNR